MNGKRAAILRAMVLAMLIILLPFMIVLANFRLLVYNEDFYRAELKRADSYSRYNDAGIFTDKLLDYFKNKKAIPEELNEREKKHMEDVKRIINLAIYALYFLIFTYILLLYFLFRLTKNIDSFFSYFSRAMLAGGLLLLFLMIISFIIFANFHPYFDRFHYIFFEEGTWNFPEGSILIRVYPEQFFYDGAQGMAVNSMLASLGIFFLSFCMMKGRKHIGKG